MKKLMLIGMTVVTGLLVLTFVAPAAATGAVRAVPNLHLSLGSSSADQVSGSQQASGSGPGSSARSIESLVNEGVGGGNTEPLVAIMKSDIHSDHTVATSAHPNCGRFGNGFHGGKHDFTCPNQPFAVSFPGNP